jgi:hypothetical protein
VFVFLVQRWISSGVAKELHSFFEIIHRVLSVRINDLGVISFFFEVLSIKLYPPPNCSRNWVLWEPSPFGQTETTPPSSGFSKKTMPPVGRETPNLPLSSDPGDPDLGLSLKQHE